MTIKAVIFDLGGVLVRTEDRTPRENLAGRLGMTYDELSRLIYESESARLATVGETTAQEHWEFVRNALNLTTEEFLSVPRDFWGGDRLDTVLVDYIRSLRSGYKTALLSNAWDNLRQTLIHEWQIDGIFDQLIISAEVGTAKPAPRIYQIALERLNLTPDDAVFVDDFVENVEGARAVGLYSIHFQDPGRARAELERLLDGK